MTDALMEGDVMDVDEAQLERLLEAGALFRLLAKGFAYPKAGHAEAMKQEIEAVQVGEETQIGALLAALRQVWNHPDQELEGEYNRLFLGHAPCPLHETAYGDALRMGGRTTELADVRGFYRAFGLEPSSEDPHLPDHLSTELEFYSLLLVKQAYAMDNGWAEQEEISRDAGRKFLEHHLGRWITPLVEGIAKQAGEEGNYTRLGVVLNQAITQECHRLEVIPMPFSGLLLGDEMQGDEMVCPKNGELPQLM